MDVKWTNTGSLIIRDATYRDILDSVGALEPAEKPEDTFPVREERQDDNGRAPKEN